MEHKSLIPYAEAIPAPVEIFIILEQLFFLIHIILINLILGLGLILLFKWNKKEDFFDKNKPFAQKIPIFFALGINMAIPALLFLQVVFGHLFYTSSILMGKYWILIIPLLIIAYYSAYFNYRKFQVYQSALYALALMILIVFYIAFMLVNNLTMMESPSEWYRYFNSRSGTILLWNIPSIYPRFLHFLVASVAIGGIFYSFYFSRKVNSDEKVKEGLKIFAYATVVQIGIGLWFLLSLPHIIMQKYLGGDLIATLVFVLGIATALLSVIVSIKGKLKGSIIFLILTLVFMVINRYNLRVFQLEEIFSIFQLKIVPQWDIFILFFLILMVGILAIVYMLNIAFFKSKRETR